MLEIAADKFEREVLVNLFLIGLRFWYLEDEPATFLILLILPCGLDALSEKLNRIDFFEGLVCGFVSAWGCWYVFCLNSSLRKKLEREAMGE